jgi:hypothetical protein
MIGLNVPEPAIIHVDAETIRRSNISFQLAGSEIVPPAGLQFGSRLIVDEEVHDWLPTLWLGRISNVREFAGMLVFDKWTGNADGRQVVFHKSRSQRKYTAAFIDFGYCFNAAEWSFPDSPLRGAYARQEIYAHIDSWNNFEPWLSRIEGCSLGALEEIAEEIPSEWYGDRQDVDQLIHSLFERRADVRQLIEDFRYRSLIGYIAIKLYKGGKTVKREGATSDWLRDAAPRLGWHGFRHAALGKDCVAEEFIRRRRLGLFGATKK